MRFRVDIVIVTLAIFLAPLALPSHSEAAALAEQGRLDQQQAYRQAEQWRADRQAEQRRLEQRRLEQQRADRQAEQR